MTEEEIVAEAERLWSLTQADFILEGGSFSSEEIFGIVTALVKHTKSEMTVNGGFVNINKAADNLGKLYFYIMSFWAATLDTKYQDDFWCMLENIETALKLLKQAKNSYNN